MRSHLQFLPLFLALFLVPFNAIAQPEQDIHGSHGQDGFREQPAQSVKGVNAAFNLPLVLINTDGQEIPDEPRIQAEMKIIDNGVGNLNKRFDPPNVYDGFISIEQRGESSAGFPKKSYSLELQLEDGTNNNVSILGFPEENDFVLYAPYSDKTFMRNVLVYSLYLQMGHWAPRCRFVEVLLNGDYRGIYVLMEKIKRDENRVDIDKLVDADVTDPEITGGYIMRRDKNTGMEPYEYWNSPVEQIYFEPLIYQYFDPDYYELNEAQRTYIRDYMQGFDEMMTGPDFDDPDFGYHAWIDVSSFIDMLIINELSKGLDAYMFSTYFFKQNDEDGGKLFAGPPWDYNISLYNVNYGWDHDIPYVHSWVYDKWSRVYWWARLMEDEDFEWEVLCRWEELRQGILSNEYLEAFIDNTAAYLGDAVVRNYNKFPILGTYVWPNYEWPGTYGGELTNMKNWIEGRLHWIDGEWGGVCEYVGDDAQVIAQPEAEGIVMRIRPNPTDMRNVIAELKNVNRRSAVRVELFDINGALVYTEVIADPDPSYVSIHFPDLSYLPDGMYMVRASNAHGLLATERIVKLSR